MQPAETHQWRTVSPVPGCLTRHSRPAPSWVPEVVRCLRCVDLVVFILVLFTFRSLLTLGLDALDLTAPVGLPDGLPSLLTSLLSLAEVMTSKEMPVILWTLVVDGLRVICSAGELSSLSEYVFVLQEPQIPRHATAWWACLCV